MHHRLARSLRIQLSAQRQHLPVGKLPPFRIRQQPVQAASNMPQVERHRRHSIRAAPKAPHGSARRTSDPHLLPQAPAHAAPAAARRHIFPAFLATTAPAIYKPLPSPKPPHDHCGILMLPSTASFIACISSALTLPASRPTATPISGCSRSESSRKSGTASYGGK